MWQKILTWTPESNAIWLVREIGTFLRNIKDAQRAGKKINLRTNAKVFRTRSDNPHSHDEACLFTYFIPDFKRHTTEAQFDDMFLRMTKGCFDKEPNEKARVMDNHLSVLEFRFLSMITGQNMKVSGPTSTVDHLVEKAETSDLDLFEAKLKQESNMWVNCQHALKQHHAESR